jgi:hypothetical protein
MLAMIFLPEPADPRHAVTVARTGSFGRSHCASMTIGADESSGRSS